jgi:hypothetical protein
MKFNQEDRRGEDKRRYCLQTGARSISFGRHLNSGVNTKNWNMLLNFIVCFYGTSLVGEASRKAGFLVTGESELYFGD